MKLKYTLFAPVFLLLLLSVASYAQSDGYYPGELIVQVNAEEEFSGGLDYGLEFSDIISADLGIYLLTFDAGKYEHSEVENWLYRQPWVKMLQKNHVITNRNTVPDDPGYPGQWHFNNDGINGAKTGADIDAERAWDLTTGGRNVANKDIVIAVIDDGMDFSHPDFEGNRWVNEGEIPDNGVDDDGNGYVDDYRGWNIFEDNDNVVSGDISHGVAVSGMIGAKGNNTTDITGINWDVKIMTIVRGSRQESNVLKAYEYIRKQREIYNQSNGASGAYIVAANSSWGTNIFPSEAPLWCAFYDAMGAEGILSVAATANEPIDIDVAGDMPTGCTSDYLLSVTASNSSDDRSSFAAFGKVGIDLMAPGQQVSTLAVGSGSSIEDGTSYASPLVAGVVGLVYALDCTTLYELSVADPAAATLLVRDYILQGVDPIAGTENDLVTGGRLNAFNTLSLVDGNCPDCLSATSVEIDNVGEESTIISWKSIQSVDEVSIRYREIGQNDWIELADVSSPFEIPVVSCTSYELELLTACGDVQTDPVTLTFTSEGCCSVPPELEVVGTSSDAFVIAWESVLAADDYDIRYRNNNGNWVDIREFESTNLAIGDLESCQAYEVQLKSNCGAEVSEFSNSTIVFTDACATCSASDYCDPGQPDVEFEWINSISLNGVRNESGKNGGYGVFTEGPFEAMRPGQEVEFEVEPGFKDGSPFNEYIRAWIDFNQDGDFDDSGEEVYTSEEPTQGTVTGSIQIDEGTLPGNTRLRVAMKFMGVTDNAEPESCGNFNAGEVEDYCILILPLIDCRPVEDFRIDTIAEDIVTLSWTNPNDVNTVNIRYRAEGSAVWDTLFDASAPLNIALETCDLYEFEIQSVCDGEVTPFGSTLSGQSVDCCQPPLIIESNEVDDTVTLSWIPLTNALGYNIRYRDLLSDWRYVNQLTQAEARLSNLTPCQLYEVEVQVICLDDTTSYGGTSFFTTSECIPCKQAYCPIPRRASTQQWISSVNIGGEIIDSDPSFGYSIDTTQPSFYVYQRDISFIEVRQGNASDPVQGSVRAWLDYNKDGIFDPNDEVLAQGMMDTDGVYFDFFEVPDRAQTGNTRLRISMFTSTDTFPNPCDVPETGEVADFCAIVLEPEECPMIDTIEVVMSSAEETVIAWPTVDTALAYTVRYRPQSGGEWEELATTDTSASLPMLEACRSYDVQVRTICPFDTSQLSRTLSFEAFCPVSVEDPGYLSSVTIFPNPFSNEVRIEWEGSSAALEQIRILGVNGQELSRRSVSSADGSNRFIQMHEFRSFDPGIYFIEISSDRGIDVRKVIKQ